MTQQKSDRRIVSQGTRKDAPIRGTERPGGEKAATVTKRYRQLELPFKTAENPKGTSGDPDSGGTQSGLCEEPKLKDKNSTTEAATMTQVILRLESAFERVARNQGAPGPDGETIQVVRENLPDILRRLSKKLADGTYLPGDIRRVWIPKASGGQRGLGIPNVVDRMVQEAIRQVLEPVYEPTFHNNSHGFRPGRSCHTAIAQVRSFVEEGYDWVVDIDLSKFFDRVHHQRLLARLSSTVKDPILLSIIARFLKAKVVMPDGVKASTDEGVPQGGPLSPLLSNIVLDEFDRELSQRGHRFVRYADDCNIYVGSPRAGQRVKASVTRFLERRLRLQVNEDKSAVARPEERHFLGFSLRRDALTGEVEVRLSARSERRLRARIKELTPRLWGNSLRACIRGVTRYLRGWMGFFHICTEATLVVFGSVDAHVRRRLRAIQLAQWKSKRTIARRFIQLGMRRNTAYRAVYQGAHRLWYLSRHPGNWALRNAYFAHRGLVSLKELWHRHHELGMVAPHSGG